MYKSIIDIIYGPMRTTIDNDVVKAVQAYDINVDKEELIRALKYDRDQYSAGYADGKRDVVAHGRWLKNWCDNNMIGHEYAECSVCGCSMLDTNQFWNSKHCPNCGAQMDLEEL